MFRLFKGLYSELSKHEEKKVLIIGPESSGKTTFLNQIKKQCGARSKSRSKIRPTKGLNHCPLLIEKTQFTFWDLAGNKNYWRIWKNYFGDADLIIFMVDGCYIDKDKFESDVMAFETLILHPDVEGKTVLLLINKNDQPDFNSNCYVDLVQNYSKLATVNLFVEEISAYDMVDPELLNQHLFPTVAEKNDLELVQAN